ncbi:putative hydrolase [Thermobifida fusca YX]|uniref:Putative hydrolase n=1 Tax=Thermobifida fusca (strain YX) TaxID=269800 RepID=Q47QJ7_THEFY|nr:putative hydrolase [Thermobifida fusca YX]
MPSAADRRPPIEQLTALASATAAQTDLDRRVPPETIDLLTDAGFFRWSVPADYGGAAGSFTDLARHVVHLSRHCPSTGWLASLFGHSGRYVACLPEEGRKEVWGSSPDVRIVSVVKPLGRATRVAGGWRLSGRWTYASGVEYSDWALLAGPAQGPGSDGGPPRFFAVPRSDYTYEDTWHTLGMRGTGSHDIVIDDAFVPDHRTCLREDAMQGRTAEGDRRYAPTRAVNGLTFVTPALGAALGALDAALPLLKGPAAGPRAASHQAYQIAYARAAGQIDAARLLLDRVAETADAGRFTPELVQRSRRDSALALEMLTSAVDALARTGGTRGQADSHPLQRYWRDVRSVSGHAVMQFEQAGLAYTQSLLAAG